MKRRKTNLYRYQQLFEKCRKLQQRLTKALQSDGFYDWSKRKQQEIQTKLQCYNRQLNRLKGIATTSMTAVALGTCLAALTPQTVQAQGTPIIGPFGITANVNDVQDPEFVDIDGDGDFDLFMSHGNLPSDLLFYRNTGCAKIPNFVQEPLPPITSQISDEESDYSLAIAFGDIDGDEDFDLAISTYSLCRCLPDDDSSIEVFFLENVGTKTNPIFEQIAFNDCGGGTVDPLSSSADDPPGPPGPPGPPDPPGPPTCLQDISDRIFPAQGITIRLVTR